MENEHLKTYIHQKLQELENGKDLQELQSKGKLSFGIEATAYSHLPSWTTLLMRKKRMVRRVWLLAIFLSVTVLVVVGDISSKFEQNWLKAIVYLLVYSATITLFYVIWFFVSLFHEFRQTERVIRKLIYEDILQKLDEV